MFLTCLELRDTLEWQPVFFVLFHILTTATCNSLALWPPLQILLQNLTGLNIIAALVLLFSFKVLRCRIRGHISTHDSCLGFALLAYVQDSIKPSHVWREFASAVRPSNLHFGFVVSLNSDRTIARDVLSTLWPLCPHSTSPSCLRLGSLPLSPLPMFLQARLRLHWRSQLRPHWLSTILMEMGQVLLMLHPPRRVEPHDQKTLIISLLWVWTIHSLNVALWLYHLDCSSWFLHMWIYSVLVLLGMLN